MICEYSKDKKDSIDVSIVRKMYELLGTNMTAIVPSYHDWKADDEFQKWEELFFKNLDRGTKHVLFLDGNDLRGFISYTIDRAKDEVFFNEFQINSGSQGDGVTFRRLMVRFVADIQNEDCGAVRTYANKRNRRSQRLVEHIGFKRADETERGFRYSINKEVLVRRFNGF